MSPLRGPSRVLPGSLVDPQPELGGPFDLLLMDKILHDPSTLNYGNYGIFPIMGNAGFRPSTVVSLLSIP